MGDFCYLCLMLVFVTKSCLSPNTLVITCWERAYLMDLMCFVFSYAFVTFPYGIQGQASRLYNFFSCSTQLSTKFIPLIIVKMPTIVGILTLISMKNTTSGGLKARNFFICRYFSF